MDDFLNKKYKLMKSEKFEEYLKFIGVGLISRKTASSLSPTVMLVRNPDGSFTFTLSSPLRSIVSTFKMDEEFIEERPDGVKVKTTFLWQDGKLVQTQTEDNGRTSIHIREFKDDTLTVTSTADGWDDVCIRTYQLVK